MMPHHEERCKMHKTDQQYRLLLLAGQQCQQQGTKKGEQKFFSLF